MNELQIFSNSAFGKIRTLEDHGKPLFCGSDVAKALGYSNPRDALVRHCKGVVKRDTPTSSGIQEMSFISEGDVYRLITHSKLPAAEQFERWVFDEILPALRRSGTYSVTPEKKALAEAKLNNSRARVASLWLQIADKVPVPTYQQICASKASAVLSGGEPVLPLPAVAEKTYSAEEVGAKLGISANMVGRIANQHGLKQPQYGVEVWDKSRNSAKQVPCWRYNNAGVQALRDLLAAQQ